MIVRKIVEGNVGSDLVLLRDRRLMWVGLAG